MHLIAFIQVCIFQQIKLYITLIYNTHYYTYMYTESLHSANQPTKQIPNVMIKLM